MVHQLAGAAALAGASAAASSGATSTGEELEELGLPATSGGSAGSAAAGGSISSAVASGGSSLPWEEEHQGVCLQPRLVPLQESLQQYQ